MPALITRDLVALDVDLGPGREQVIEHLAGLVVTAGRATEVGALYADAWAREQKTDTGVPGGIAIPHCRSTSVLEPTLAMARLKPAVDFGSFDGPADIVFFIAAPDGADDLHLKVLSKLARSLIREEFVADLRAATTPERIVELVEEATADEPEVAPVVAATPAGSSETDGSSERPVLVGVTACPTGIAHTYMAADSLVAAAKKLGVDLYIETQGSGTVVPLDPAIIARASAAIFAVDVDVRDKSRFAGKPVIQSPVKRGIDEPKTMIEEALAAAANPHAARVAGGAEAAPSGSVGLANDGVGSKIKRWLLTGVSYMIPFVAGGGLLIALGFLLAGISLPDQGYTVVSTGVHGVANNVYVLQHYTLFHLPPEGLGWYLGSVFTEIGQVSLGFLVAALAGYIAYAIADRPGIAPGFVAGGVAVFMGAGFIGGLAGGLLAGGAAYWIGRPTVPRWLRGLMPVVIIPLLASIVASGLLLLVLGGPIAALTKALSDFLNGLTGTGVVILGIILGLMMCFDLGGPVNKVAYAFAVAGLNQASASAVAPYEIMAAVMSAGMVPPLAMALASTVLYRRGFTDVERENGMSAWLLGASFISEGAIPFAAADPLRVIPSSMVGGAVTGALSMALGVTSRAPHGGIFVFFAIGNIFGWLFSIVAGVVVTALVLIVLKRFVRRSPAPGSAGAVSADQAAGIPREAVLA